MGVCPRLLIYKTFISFLKIDGNYWCCVSYLAMLFFLQINTCPIARFWLLVVLSCGLVACDMESSTDSSRSSMKVISADSSGGADVANDEKLEEAALKHRAGAANALPVIPPELLDDEHVREEYGINEFTTPSIRRLFEDLDALGDIPFQKLRPVIPQKLSSERSLLALSLGVLIADGFLAVQAEDINEIESIGKSILKTAKALGSGRRISQHGKALLENSLLGNWDDLKDELAATQKDVELEMLLLRDHEIAHLVGLGGWIRALEIAATTAQDTGENVAGVLMNKPEVVDYFTAGLATLHPRILKKQHIVQLRAEMTKLQKLLSSSDELVSEDLDSEYPHHPELGGEKHMQKDLMPLMPQIEHQAQEMLRLIREKV